MRYLKKLTAALICANFIAYSPSALAQNVVNFTDVPAEHWAASAIRDLTEKYSVVGGYPDQTFRGTRNITRYEAAAAFVRIMEKVSEVEELTRRIGTVSLDDLKQMKALSEEFKNEIDALKKQNTEQAEKIQKLEESLTKLKEDIGSVRFGGLISVGAEDVFEDNFRPGYSAYFSLNMRIAATEKTTIRSALSGSFSSVQEQNDDGEQGKKSQFKEARDISVGFGEAWFDHQEKSFLNPRVKFGFMGVTRLITPFTSVPNQFGNSIVGIIDTSAIDRASPNLFGAGRGIRLTKSFIAGVDFSEGPFAAALAASPDVFYGQVGLNWDFVKLKLVSEGDQALFIGTPVLDTLHNHTAILDIGNDVFGVGLQATFRGLDREINFRGAAASTNITLGGFTLGGSGKFESEDTYQQLMAGIYFATPSNLKTMNKDWPDTNIPSLMIGLQSPFTYVDQTGQFFEGSPDEVGDMAGFLVQVAYDNPIIPNLTVELGRRQKVFINTLPTDSAFDKTTIAVSSAFFF